jgi:glutamate synthase (NADPH/NADH) large chain
MAELGFRTMDEMVGRADCLDVERAVTHWKANGLDLGPVLEGPAFAEDEPRRNTTAQLHELDEHFDVGLIERAQDVIANGGEITIDLPIRNTERAVGTLLGHHVTKARGENGLRSGSIVVNLTGSAGQSFGAFMPAGITLRLEGDSNDYVGKGLSGGQIVVRPPRGATFDASQNVIAGNVIGYGATLGTMFLRGVVGERFFVRNSGATAVVEGVGDHGCEYMTGGTVLVLGPTGRNFAAGMSGGVAYVLDLDHERVNKELVGLSPLRPDDEAVVADLLRRHREWTESSVAARLLEEWDEVRERFTLVLPRDYQRVLDVRAAAQAEGLDVNGSEVWERIMEASRG